MGRNIQKRIILPRRNLTELTQIHIKHYRQKVRIANSFLSQREHVGDEEPRTTLAQSVHISMLPAKKSLQTEGLH